MYFDRFDVCEAFWHFAAEYHGGAGTGEYAIFSRLHRIGWAMRRPDKRSMSDNARDILASMIRRWRRGESPVRGGTGRGPRRP